MQLLSQPCSLCGCLLIYAYFGDKTLSYFFPTVASTEELTKVQESELYFFPCAAPLITFLLASVHLTGEKLGRYSWGHGMKTVGYRWPGIILC